MANFVDVPLPTLRRLPFYLRILREREAEGDLWFSSEALGKRLGLGAIQVRKDLGSIGATGKAKYGFPVPETARIVAQFLSVEAYSEVVLLGANELASAVLADESIALHGLKIVAVFDADPARVDTELRGFRVLPLSSLSDFVRGKGVRIAVLAVGIRGIRAAAEEIARSGLAGVYDLTGLAVPLPEGLVVIREDFGSRLAALASELVSRTHSAKGR